MLFGGETAQSYYEEGLTAAMKGEIDRAIGYFKRASELDAELHQAHHQIGRCLVRLGKGADAVASLEYAVKHLPGAIPPQLDLGFALLQTGQADAARDVFSSVLTQKESEPRAVLGLAYCAFHKEQWVTCMNLAQRAIELGRNQFDVHYLLARAADHASILEVSTIHYQKSAELMDRSIEASPEQVAGYYLRGRVYDSMQIFAQALEDMDEALNHAEESRFYYAYNEFFSRSDIIEWKERIQQKLVREKPGQEGMGDNGGPPS